MGVNRGEILHTLYIRELLQRLQVADLGGYLLQDIQLNPTNKGKGSNQNEQQERQTITTKEARTTTPGTTIRATNGAIKNGKKSSRKNSKTDPP